MPLDPSSLRIRPLEPTDVDAIHAILVCPGVIDMLVEVPSLTRAEVLERYGSPSPRYHAFVGVIDGRVIAHAGLSQSLRPRLRHAAEIWIAIHDDAQGKGLGRALLTYLLDVADRFLALRRIELKVHATNARAIHLYESLGFEREGIHRGEVFCQGTYLDTWSMARIRG